MNTLPQKKNIPFQQVLAALLDEQNPFPPAYLHHFSDLEGADLKAFRSVWPQVKANRRFTMLEDLEELSDTDTLVSFDNVARAALEDTDPRVRSVAIRLLWEAEDPGLANTLIDILNTDPDTNVRAAAANGLGKYVYLGEVEEFPAEQLHVVEDQLLKTFATADNDHLRQEALASLGFSSREEVPPLIRSAYESSDPEWIANALFAMGRSADQVWEPDVKRMLHHPKADVQLEAVRAAGELALESTRRILLDLLEEEAQDSEIRAAVIWSLSQIGGEEVRETLENLLEETDDDEEMEILEDALDNLSFTEDDAIYGLFDFNQLGQPNEEIEDMESYTNLQEDEIDETFGAHPYDANSGDPDNKILPPEKDTDQKRHRHRKSPKD